MSSAEVLIGVVLGLIVNETTDLSPWLGRALVGWSARLRYGETDRAQVRSEELKALVNVRPGKLFKLFMGVAFATSALVFRLRRLIRPQISAGDEPFAEKPIDVIRGAYREDEPTTLVARYLFPTERYRGEWKRHWIAVLRSAGIITLYGVLGIWVTNLRVEPRYRTVIIAGVCVLCVLLFAYRIVFWYFDRFVITNKRLMMTRGLVYRRVEMIPLLRVTNLEYVQGPLGRLLSYGSFRTNSRENRRSIRRMRDLPNPNELYLRIIEEVYEPEAVEARLESPRTATEHDDVIAALKALVAALETSSLR